MYFKYSKSIILISFFFFIIKLNSQNPSALYQNWVDAQTNNTTSVLPTFSFAGYHNGETSLPSSFSQQVYDVTKSPFNAVANDNISDKEAIKAAIAAAELNPNGGIIFFPPGRFIVNDSEPTEAGVTADDSFEVIRISKSNIVIKGSGSGIGGTELYQKSYTDHVDKASKDYSCPYLFYFWNGEDSANSLITNVTANAERETYTVQVESTTNITEGQWVELYVKNNDSAFVSEELVPFSTSDFYEPENLKIVNDGVEVREVHKIVSKTSSSITFKEPIHRTINASYNWKINNFMALEEVGIQDLKYTGGFIWNHLHHKAPQELYPGEASLGPHAFLSSSGWSGIQFNHVVNGWITNVEFSGMSQAAQFKFSANSTALNNKYTGNPGHNFISTNASTSCFLGKNIDNTTGVWHGSGVNAVSIGNVLWRNEHPQNGNSGIEVHASQPRSTLVDVCKGGMFFNQGGSTGALPNHLKHMVLWNFEGVSYQNTDVKTFRPNSETKYAKFITPIISGLKGFTMSTDANQYQENESQGTHVDEESLYEEQLKYRLGSLPSWINNIESKTIFYYEDFAFDSNRGFDKKIISEGGHTVPANIIKRVSDIPELLDSNNLFDDVIDRGSNRIPNGGSQDQKTISIRADDGTTNFAVDAYTVFTTLDLTSANTLINSSDDFIYASFWTQRRYGEGDIATVTMRVSTDYSDDASAVTWTTLPIHSGKLGDTSDGRKFVKAMVDLSSYAASTTVTLALRYQGSSSAYNSSNRNGTFYISDLQFIAQSSEIKNVWNGNTSSDLTEPANWDTKAAPVNTTNNLVIPFGVTNYPTATNALTFNKLTLKSGALFKAESTVTGNVTFERNLTFKAGNLEGWHLIGSPVNGQTYNAAFVTTNSIASGSGNNRGIAFYNNVVATNNWSYLKSDNSNSGTFLTATGYSMKTSENKIVSFTGTLNTEDVNKEITIGSTTFNLLSNPFTTYINSGAFLDLVANSNKLTSKTIWVWNPLTKNYDTKVSNSSFKLAPGQGFFVSCLTAGNLTFKEDIQNHETLDTFLKSSSKPEIKLNITDENLNRYTKIYYNDIATNGFDNGLDGETFAGVENKFDVFTQLLENNKGENYQIQSLPYTNLESIVIPVGIKADAGKEITFSADVLNLPTDLKLFLEDRLTNTFIRLDEVNSNYKVTLKSTLNGIGRFYLYTTKTALINDQNIVLENISIYKIDSSTLRITGLKQGEKSIKLFNILGKQFFKSTFKSSGVNDVVLPKLATGVYIIQLTSKDSKFNKKIIL